MKKKIISALLAAVMLMGSLTGCGNNSEQSKESTESTKKEESAEAVSSETDNSIKGTITFAQHRTDLEAEINALIADFNKIYPDITVNLETIADYQNVMGVRLASKEVPDVLEMRSLIIDRDKWADYFAPLNDTKLYGKNLFDDYYSVDGQLYGYNQIGGYICMMYNKDLYAQAGIEELPTTWAEFEEVLEKLSQLDDVIPLTTQYKTEWAIQYWLCYYIPSVLGNEWYTSMTKTDAPFSEETVTMVLNNVRSAVDQGYCDPELMSSDWDLQATDFAAGKIGTYCCGTYAYSTMTALGMDPDSIGFYAFPDADLTKDGKPSVYAPVDWALAISKDTENYEAAVAFAEFLGENYTSYTNQITSAKGETVNIEAVNEMLEAEPTIVTEGVQDPVYTAINNDAGISMGAIVQEYLVADDPATVLEKYNSMWAEALGRYSE